MIKHGGYSVYAVEVEAALDRASRRARGRGPRAARPAQGRGARRRGARPRRRRTSSRPSSSRGLRSICPTTRRRGRSSSSTSCPAPAPRRCRRARWSTCSTRAICGDRSARGRRREPSGHEDRRRRRGGRRALAGQPARREVDDQHAAVGDPRRVVRQVAAVGRRPSSLVHGSVNDRRRAVPHERARRGLIRARGPRTRPNRRRRRRRGGCT